MTHGDNNGLVLPPAVAPIQIVIIPVAQHKEGVMEANTALYNRLCGKYRVKLDDSDNSPGWKFAEYEMKGVPMRIEMGPRDIEAGQCVIVTRYNMEKIIVSLDNIEETVADMMKKIRDGMYENALANRERRTFACTSIDEIKKTIAEHGGVFIKAMWCSCICVRVPRWNSR